jgi:hypothetical protein
MKQQMDRHHSIGIQKINSSVSRHRESNKQLKSLLKE